MRTGIPFFASASKTALVVMQPTEELSRVLWAIRDTKAACARIVLAQLSPFQNATREGIWHSPWQPVARTVHAPKRNGAGDRHEHSTAWSEILSEVFLIGCASAGELAELARQLHVDRVVLPSPATAECIWQDLSRDENHEEYCSPLWVLNPNIPADFIEYRKIRSILFPLSLRPGFEGRLHTACRLAISHDAKLSILHVFEDSSANPIGERSPLAVHSLLPLRSLRLSGLLCPMEVCIRAGDPADAILAFQQNGGHDLILMRGPRNCSDERLRPGGVMHRVLSEARCPVMIVGDAPLSADRLQPMTLTSALRADRDAEFRPKVDLVN